jgi:MurNAc alpha-1-phosphate uridylyltransferase
MQCVILAGGRGTRMAPSTDSVPKALLPVAGRPFADWQLSWLASEGVGSVTYAIGYLGHLIRRYVGSGERWGLDVRYVDEGHDLRGTGGALRQAFENDALEEQFSVLYGDSYLCLNLLSAWEALGQSEKSAMMTVYRNDGKWERSNATFEDGVVTRYEKGLMAIPSDMRYVDYGLSFFHRSTVERWIAPDAVVDLASVFAELSAAGELAGYEAHERFYEIGSPEGLGELESLLQA